MNIIFDHPECINVNEKTSPIKGLQDIRDVYMLSRKSREELPLLINYPFSRVISEIYKRCLSDGLVLNKIIYTGSEKYHTYECVPIDDWQRWTPIYMENLLQNSVLMNFVINSMKLFEKIGWEGDIRQGPFLKAMPDGTPMCSFVLALKQDNNGTTYVCSECVELHVEEDIEEEVLRYMDPNGKIIDL